MRHNIFAIELCLQLEPGSGLRADLRDLVVSHPSVSSPGKKWAMVKRASELAKQVARAAEKHPDASLKLASRLDQPRRTVNEAVGEIPDCVKTSRRNSRQPSGPAIESKCNSFTQTPFTAPANACRADTFGHAPSR